MARLRGGLERGIAWLRARPRALAAAALLVPPAFLLRDALLGQGALYVRDIHLYWHAEAEAFVRAIAAGSWPVWDRTVGFGQPLLANSSAQVLYPLTWLNLLMRPWWYYTVFVVAHLVWSAAGAHAAARRLECGRLGAAAAAALWTASGPFVSYTILWHHFAGAAWLPWVLATALGFAAAPRPRALAALASVLALQVLAGSFEMAAMGGAVAAAAVCWSLSARAASLAAARPVLLRSAGAAALAVGLSAAQWAPTLDVALRSGRSALTREVRTYWSLHPIAAADLLLPGFSAQAPVAPEVRRAFFEGREPFLASLYLGLPALPLALAGLLDRRRRAGGVLAAAGLVALVFALGRHAPLYDIVTSAVPPLKAFRYPVKVMVLVALPWCLLAGMGVDFLRRGDPASGVARWVRVAAVGTAGLAALAAAALTASGSPAGARNAAVAAVAAVLGAACVFAALRGGRGRSAAAAAAAVVALADLLAYHRTLNDVAPVALYAHRPEALARLDPAPDARLYAYDYTVAPETAGVRSPRSQRLARWPEGWTTGPAVALGMQMALAPVTASRWGRMGSFEVDYTGLFPVHVNQAAYLLRALEGTPAHLRMLQLAGVDDVVALHDDPFADLRPTAVLPGLFEVPIRVFAVPEPLPPAFVAGRTRAGEGESGLAVLLETGFDFRREALVPASAAPARGMRPGRARIVTARPDALTIEADAPDGGYLVVLESYDPGWRATVDGVESAVVPANVLFRGVAVAPGTHRIEMTYRPPGVIAGFAVSALSLLAVAVLSWRPRRRAAGVPS